MTCKNKNLGYFDSHAHINLITQNIHDQLINEWQDIMSGIIQVSTDIHSYTFGKQLAQAYPQFIFCTAGIHPSNAESYTTTTSNTLNTILQEGHAVAIGECGLDYQRNYATKQQQLTLFHTHIELAQAHKLPLIIHSRNAHQDTLDILKTHTAPKTGIIHCYSGTTHEAQSYIDLGYYISFAGNVTYKNALTIQESAKTIPQNRILIETDSPYLAPVPHRGKANLPTYIHHTATYISQLRNIPIEKLQQITYQNTLNIFQIHNTENLPT